MNALALTVLFLTRVTIRTSIFTKPNTYLLFAQVFLIFIFIAILCKKQLLFTTTIDSFK
jgi:hypothetical protein